MALSAEQHRDTEYDKPHHTIQVSLGQHTLAPDPGLGVTWTGPGKRDQARALPSGFDRENPGPVQKLPDQVQRTAGRNKRFRTSPGASRSGWWRQSEASLCERLAETCLHLAPAAGCRVEQHWAIDAALILGAGSAALGAGNRSQSAARQLPLRVQQFLPDQGPPDQVGELSRTKPARTENQHEGRGSNVDKT